MRRLRAGVATVDRVCNGQTLLASLALCAGFALACGDVGDDGTAIEVERIEREET